MENPSILFSIKKSKASADGLSPVYVRITLGGRRAEISINRKVHFRSWNSVGNGVIGTAPEAFTLNRYLSKIKTDIYKHFQNLTENGDYITAIELRDAFLGKNKDERMVLKIFQDHNDQVEALVGQEYSPGTLERYRTARKH